MRQSYTGLAFDAGRLERPPHEAVEVVIPTLILDVVLGPVGPTPDACVPEENVAACDGLVPDLAFRTEDRLGGDSFRDHAGLEGEPVLSSFLIEEEVACSIIAQLAAVGKVVLVEVATLGGAVPVAIARLDHTLLNRFL